jgi:hypothetical protein
MAAAMLASAAVFFAAPGPAQEFRTTLQVSQQAGGHCIEVSDRQVRPGQHLEMRDCDNSVAQTFRYDPASAQLSIGGLCVDADNGQPADLVKLAPCGGAHQAWRLEPKNEFVKFIGMNNQCLDIRYGSTELGALLQSWTCGEAEPNQLWRLQRK